VYYIIIRIGTYNNHSTLYHQQHPNHSYFIGMNINISLINFMKLFGTNVQYSVPKWQRRYSWDKSTIEQLVKDLNAIAKKKGNDVMHFGGTLITYAEHTPAGMAEIHNVVDGQQRLTTISVLLACIAKKLEEKNSASGEWDSLKITNVLLKNTLDPPEKLSLQDVDNDEYRNLLAGSYDGKGKITDAWKILSRSVDIYGPDILMKGLNRFKVISFPCQSSDDPQQIFESLNATGVMLSEGEKTKNWLLMGLDRDTQERVYFDHWCRLENYLDAVSEPKRIDEFLRDFLRWKTGENVGLKQAYVNLRRWWYEYGGDDRVQLCERLADLAQLYGMISGTNDETLNSEINTLLKHIRGLRIDVHRPFTLRLLDDAIKPELTGAQEKQVIKVLTVISTWLTRLWLSGKRLSGLNTQFAHFAHSHNEEYIEAYGNHWIEEVKRLRKTSIAVPNDLDVIEGIKKRKAYGGKASYAAHMILWTLNSKLGNPASPETESLSLEHIMPRTLSENWRQYLGDDVEEMEESYMNILPNLTLVGKKFNPEISNQSYSKKRKLYLDSSVMLTRELAKSFLEWKKRDIDAYSSKLSSMAIECWPWENIRRSKFRWRIGDNSWSYEASYAGLYLNVVSALLNLDPQLNSEMLMGTRITIDMIQSDTISSQRSKRFRPIPNYNQYQINVDHNGSRLMNLSNEKARRCGEKLDLQIFEDYLDGQEIWKDVVLND